MKRQKRKTLMLLPAVLLLISLFSIVCSADAGKTTVEELEERWESLLPDSAPSGLGESGADELSDALGFPHLIESVLASLQGKKSGIGAFCLALFGAAALLAAGEALPIDGRLSPEISAGIGCIAGLSIASALSGAFAGVRQGIEEVTAFFSGILPMFSAVLCAGGSAMTAGVQSAGMELSLSFIAWMNEKLLLPLSGMLLAFASVGTLDTEGRCVMLSERIYKCFLSVLGILSTILLATVALQSTIASAKDSSAIRAARYAAGLLPAVGSTLSGSLSVLSSGILYLKNAVGISAVAVMIGMAAGPLAELILYRIGFFLSGIFLLAVGAKNGERLFSSFWVALDAMTASYIFSVVVCFLETVIFLKSGVGIA